MLVEGPFGQSAEFGLDTLNGTPYKSLNKIASIIRECGALPEVPLN